MKKDIILSVLVLSSMSYAMENDLESGVVDKPQTKYTQRVAIQYCSSPRGPKYGASLKMQTPSSYIVTQVPETTSQGLISALLGSNGAKSRTIDSVISGSNITLWRNDDTTYDVIYRSEDGTVVAEDLETGETFYQIKLERSQGSATETLLQSEQGVLQVTDGNGKITTISHKTYKHFPLPSVDEDQVVCSGHGCAHADADDNE